MQKKTSKSQNRRLKSDSLSSISDCESLSSEQQVDDYGVPIEASNDDKINGIVSSLRTKTEKRFVKASMVSPSKNKVLLK